MKDQYFYGHGKLLLSAEYFITDGALGIGLPTTVGQGLSVRYRQSYNPKLYWKSLDHKGECWFEESFELWHFSPENLKDSPLANKLGKILRNVRKQNLHFLRDECDVLVETKLEFPRNWGLGSSSSLLYTIAQWGLVNPFELQFDTFGGSGYDIACSQAMGPIQYQLNEGKPQWSPLDFHPEFLEHLYLVYLENKQDTLKALEHYRSLELPHKDELIEQISAITKRMIRTYDVDEFNELIKAHEEIISVNLGLTRVKEKYFSDFFGEVKSLGAWGGDFALVTSKESISKTRDYFSSKGFPTLIRFNEFVRLSRVG